MGTLKERTMRWYCLLVVLLAVGLASSESSADEVQTIGPEYYGDMSVTTDNDGEDKAGRFGDYSGWIKKYHIGAHHPYHAKALGEHKVQQHKASGTAPDDAAKPASATTAKAAVETPKASRSTVASSTHHGGKATSHSKTTESRHTEHASKHDETAVAPDPADALEAELAKLEHSSAADDATDATPAKAAVDSESTGTTEAVESEDAKSVQPKKSDKHNLKESAGDDISLDSLESTLKDLEAKPALVSLIQEQESATEKSSASAHAAVKAPDMLAMLAAKFKHKGDSRRKVSMSHAKQDEDKAGEKEATMAKKFQNQFMATENKHVKKLENMNAPHNIQEALAAKKAPLQPGEKAVVKGSVGYEDKKASAEAVMAKQMTQQFLAYQKKEDQDQDLGEQADTGMSTDDQNAVRCAAAALQKTQDVHQDHKADMSSHATSKESLARLFGKQQHHKVRKTKRELISDSRKLLLGDSDKEALRMQTEMTKRSMQLQQEQAGTADTSRQATEANVASLFDHDQQDSSDRTALQDGSESAREIVPDDAQNAVKMQQQFMQRTKVGSEHRSEHEAMTESNVESLFAGHSKQQPADQSTVTMDDAEIAKQQQLQMLKQTTSRRADTLGEALGSEASSQDRHSAVEALFQGKKTEPKGRFGYKSVGEQKKLQQEFTDSANHQIRLLRQMQSQQAQELNQRSEEAVQVEQTNHGSKWDELGYQNKLRGLFGARLIKKPKKQKVTHKAAVSQFQKEISAATGFLKHKNSDKPQRRHARDETAPYQESGISSDSLVQTQEKSPKALKDRFDSLLQDETSQFQQIMNSKKQQMGVLSKTGQQLAGEEFLQMMKQKFDALKGDMKAYTSDKQPSDPVANQDSLVQVEETSDNAANAGDSLKERIQTLAPDMRNRVLKDVAETVLDDPSSTTLHSSMLDRLTKLFHESP